MLPMSALKLKLKDRITPHVNNFSILRLNIEKQQRKRKYESDGGVMYLFIFHTFCLSIIYLSIDRSIDLSLWLSRIASISKQLRAPEVIQNYLLTLVHRGAPSAAPATQKPPAERRRPEEAYIRPPSAAPATQKPPAERRLAEHQVPHLPHKSHRQTGGD